MTIFSWVDLATKWEILFQMVSNSIGVLTKTRLSHIQITGRASKERMPASWQWSSGDCPLSFSKPVALFCHWGLLSKLTDPSPPFSSHLTPKLADWSNRLTNHLRRPCLIIALSCFLSYQPPQYAYADYDHRFRDGKLSWSRGSYEHRSSSN